MKGPQRATLSLCILFIALLEIFNHVSSSAQRTGEHAEMNRLEQQADELAAQSDSEGAALAMGKAAMMADILTNESRNSLAGEIFQAAGHLYRAQELGFRALALYERTGGTPPAPDGVCHYLFQGHQKLADSKDLLVRTPSVISEENKARRDHLLQKNEEWENLFLGLHKDFVCSDTLK